jgi:hypothetical protein
MQSAKLVTQKEIPGLYAGDFFFKVEPDYGGPDLSSMD